MNKNTLQEIISILTPLSEKNLRKQIKDNIRNLQKVGAYNECKPFFIKLKSLNALVKNNIVSIQATEDNQDFINKYLIFHFGGAINHGVYTSPYQSKMIFDLAMKGYKIKGLGKKALCLGEKLNTRHSKALSDEQRPFVEVYKNKGRLLMPHTMGKGKTPSAIIACKERNSKRILLSTTKSTITNWVEEFNRFGLLDTDSCHSLNISVINKGLKFIKDPKSTAVTSYTNKKTLFNQWTTTQKSNDIEQLKASNVIIVTHTAMMDGENLLAFLEKHNIIVDTLIIDEAHLVANSTTKRGLELRSITSKIKDVLMLTGTPINKIATQEIMFYFDILYPGLIFHGDLHKMFITKEKGITVFKNIKSLHRLMKLIAPHRLVWDEQSSKDLGVGELVINTVYCPTNEELKTKIKEIEQSDANPLVKSQYKTLAYSPYKQIKAIELIETALKTKNKIVVFSAYNKVLEHLAKRYANNSVTITGATNNRGELIKKFKEDDNCNIFLGNIKAAGIGINLQNCDYTIIIEPGYESEKVQQAIKRTHRRGNLSPVVTVDIILVEGESLEDNKENIINKKAYASSMIIDFNSDTITGNENKGGILEDTIAMDRKIDAQGRAKRQEEYRNQYDRTVDSKNIGSDKQTLRNFEKSLTEQYPWYKPMAITTK